MKARDWALFILLAMVWGTSFLWIKVALAEVGPVTLVSFRLLFGVLGLIAAALILRPEMPRDPIVYGKLALIGFINTALPFVLISWGEQHIDSGLASLFNASVPMWTLIFAHFFLADERITLDRLVGLLIGFVGIVLLVFSNQNGPINPAGQMALLGSLAVLAAGMMYGGSAVFIRSNLKGVSPIVQPLGAVLFADIYVWVAAFTLERPIIIPSQPMTWIALIWLGVLGSALAYLIYFGLIQRVGATNVTAVTYVVPVVGVTVGAIFLGEAITWPMIVAGALVLMGVYTVNAGIPFVRKTTVEEAA